MTGYHEVKIFSMPTASGMWEDSLLLPDGWKPFAAYEPFVGTLFVVARKWYRK